MRAPRRPWILALAVVFAALTGTGALVQSVLVDWAVARVVQASAGRLEVEGVTGGLVGGVRIGALRWRDGVSVHADDVRIRPNPWALLRGRIDLADVRARSIALDIPVTSEDLPAPATLRLPLGVRVGALSVGQMSLRGLSRDTMLVRDVALSADYETGRYRVDTLSFAADWGRVQAHATLADEAPYALSAGGRATLAWREIGIEADVRGTLETVTLQMKTSGDRFGALQATGPVRPLAAQMFTRFDVQGNGLDAQWLGLPDAWRARLGGRAVASVLPATRALPAGWAFELDVVNGAPGGLDAHALPIEHLAGVVEWRGDRVHLRQARAAMRGTGSLQGEMSIDTAERVDVARARMLGLSANLAVSGLDASAISASLPVTRLEGRVRWEDGRFDAELADRGRSGIVLDAHGLLRAKSLELARVQVKTVAGAATLSGRLGVAAPYPAELSLAFDRLDPSAVPDVIERFHGMPGFGRRMADTAAATRGLRALPGALSGSARVSGPIKPSAPGAFVMLSLKIDSGRLLGLATTASIQAKLAPSRLGDVHAVMTIDRATLRAEGALGGAGDRLLASVRVPSLAPFAGLPGLRGLGGSLSVDAALTGSLGDPTASVELQALAPRAAGFALDAVRARAAGTPGAHSFALEADGKVLRARLAGNGGFRGARWHATLSEAWGRERIDLALRGTASVEADASGLRVGPAVIGSRFGDLNLHRLAWRAGHYDVAAALRLERLVELAERFGSVQAGEARQAGLLDTSSVDLSLSMSGAGASDANGALSLRISGGSVVPQGMAELTVVDGRLSGRADIDLPSIAAVNRLIGPDWALGGRLRFIGTAQGSLLAPQLIGQVKGEGLRLEQRVFGWRLGEGVLDARFDGETLRVDTFRLRNVPVAGRAAPVDAGSITLTGEVGIDSRRGSFSLAASRLAVPMGPGQRVTLSGDAHIDSQGGEFNLRGAMRLDEGLIEIGAGDVPVMPEDVIVRGRAVVREASSDPAQRLRIGADLSLELGEKLRVRGRGLDARLAGKLSLRGRLPDAPRAFGTVRIREGRYVAYGKSLEVRRGDIVFNGPPDNPQLEIVALRGDQPVEAGVEVTGSALAPRVRLASVPDVPDSDKLSWLVLGGPLEDAHGQAQGAALQAAAATLLGRNDGTLSAGIANAVGLDVLTLRSNAGAQNGLVTPELGSRGFGAAMPAIPGQVGGGPQNGVQPTTGQNVVAIGKRLNSRLLVSYEQGLRGVWNLLVIQYEISQRLLLRATTGSESAADVLYRFRFD